MKLMTQPGYMPPPGQPQPQPQMAPQWPTQQQGYASPPQGGYAPQQPYGAPQPYGQQPGYGQQQMYGAPATPPAPQLENGTIADFYAQPTGGEGGGLKFPQDGAWHIAVVNRALQDGDTEHQTDMNTKQPRYDKRGKPVLALKVPVNVAVSHENQDGKARLYVHGSMRSDLDRAMAAVGAPFGPPEPGSAIFVQLKGKVRAGQFMRNDWDVRYWRPGPEAQQVAAQYNIAYPDLSQAAQEVVQPAATPAPPAEVPQVQQQAPPPVAPVAQQPPAQAAPPVAATPPPPAPAQVAPAPQFTAPVAQAPAVAQAPVQAPQVQQAPPPPGDVASLPPDKQQLFANLTGAPQA